MKAKLSLVAFGIFLTAATSAASAQEQQQGMMPPGARPRPRRCSEMYATVPEVRACEDGRAIDAGVMEERNAAKGEQLGKMQAARKVRRAKGVFGWLFPIPGQEPMIEIAPIVGLTYMYDGLLPGQNSVTVRPGVLFRAALADYFNGAVWARISLDVPAPALGGLFKDSEPDSMAMMPSMMPGGMVPIGNQGTPSMMGGAQPPVMLTAEQQALVNKMNRTALDIAAGFELRLFGYGADGPGYWRGVGIKAGIGSAINPANVYWEAGFTFNLKWASVIVDFQGPLWGVWKDLGGFGPRKVAVNLAIPLFKF